MISRPEVAVLILGAANLLLTALVAQRQNRMREASARFFRFLEEWQALASNLPRRWEVPAPMPRYDGDGR